MIHRKFDNCIKSSILEFKVRSSKFKSSKFVVRKPKSFSKFEVSKVRYCSKNVRTVRVHLQL